MKRLNKMNIAKKVGLLTLSAVLLIAAAREWLGYHNYYLYKSDRTRVKSIESGFVDLEKMIKRATMLSNNPLFEKELARLYLERAFGEIQFSEAADSIIYLDKMQESLIRLIWKNPVDADAYYEMGKYYLLYNYPLVTYVDKADLYFQKALELKPVDEFLNVNILFIYLTQWDLLENEGKAYVFQKMKQMTDLNHSFVASLRNLWKKEVGNLEILKQILSKDKKLWEEIKDYF